MFEKGLANDFDGEAAGGAHVKAPAVTSLGRRNLKTVRLQPLVNGVHRRLGFLNEADVGTFGFSLRERDDEPGIIAQMGQFGTRLADAREAEIPSKNALVARTSLTTTPR